MEKRVEPLINNSTDSQLMGVIAAVFAVILTIGKKKNVCEKLNYSLAYCRLCIRLFFAFDIVFYCNCKIL